MKRFDILRHFIVMLYAVIICFCYLR
ncbi:hypothetical protein [Bacteroides sp.]|nr:hypothetical protein [Bacteroides sp.]